MTRLRNIEKDIEIFHIYFVLYLNIESRYVTPTLEFRRLSLSGINSVTQQRKRNKRETRENIKRRKLNDNHTLCHTNFTLSEAEYCGKTQLNTG